MQQERPVSGKFTSGFGGMLPRHEQTHGQRQFKTEYATFYGRPQSAVGPVKVDRSAGLQIALKTENERKRLLTTQLGEVFNQDHDAQQRTDVQRSWLPEKDPGLKAHKVRPGTARPTQNNFFDN